MPASRTHSFAPGKVSVREVCPKGSAVHGRVPAVFWPLAFAALTGGFAVWHGWLATRSEWLFYPAIAAMLFGGLPHGACDISLAAAALRCERRELLPLVGLYILVAAAMTAFWWFSPLAALLLFLGLYGIHFGEDWAMLPSGPSRTMAGMAIITTAAFGQQERVADLFVALTGSPHAVIVARWAQAAAPLTWFVTLVGVGAAWRMGYRAWVTAYCACLLGLLVLPPLAGFTLFFVGLHAPRHWQSLQSGLPRARAIIAGHEGLWLTILTLSLWLVWMRFAQVVSPLGSSAEAFRLLSIVAAPHLALSVTIERRIALLRKVQ
ncbi:MAG: beta-carotene 15,15'-dioxygenase, Brp/Blh family [Novosphingobium sp.]